MINKHYTLCLILHEGKILLGMKKRGFGAGWWNGFGGKVHEGETLEQAAIREFQEEAGITATALEQRGVLHFEFTDKPAEQLEVTVFAVTKWQGEPMETEEMKPQWFDLELIPYDTMWPDDAHWLPIFLAGQKFRGQFVFGPDHTMIKSAVTELDQL
jgi:8-oxo-dGTP diphosphatase/2-hydroxy-dATP diphosphatase